MTKQEAMRLARQAEVLQSLGFTADEAESLRRISMTLHRWHELECGTDHGCVERDEKTGKPYYINANARYVDPRDPRARHAIPDRETGALKRLADILTARNARPRFVQGTGFAAAPGPLTAFIQTDPRGAALYIIRPGDVPAGENVDAYYSRGICVY